jgi:hypothetical protein
VRGPSHITQEDDNNDNDDESSLSSGEPEEEEDASSSSSYEIVLFPEAYWHDISGSAKSLLRRMFDPAVDPLFDAVTTNTSSSD